MRVGREHGHVTRGPVIHFEAQSMWRTSLSTAAVIYGGTLMAQPLILALFNTVGVGLVGGWVPPLALGAASAVAAFALFTGNTVVALPRNIHILAGLPILAVSMASLVGRQSLETMVFGASLETGTVGSLILFMLAVVLGSAIANIHTPRVLDMFLVSSVGGAAITLSLVLISGWESLALADTTPLILCGALIVAALRVDATRGRLRLAYGVCVLLLCALLLLSFDASAALLAVIILLLAGTVAMWCYRDKRIPWATVVVTSFLGVLLLVGLEGKYVPASPVARPSLSVTARIIGALYFQDAQSALVGIGPNGFRFAWERYRVPELNASPLWQLTPRYGYSTATTFAVTMGMLGLLAVSLMALSFTVLVARRLMDLRVSGDAKTLARALPIVALALFALVAMFTEVIETSLFLIFGVAFGMAVRALEPVTRVVSVDFSRGGSRLAAGLLATVAFGVSVWLVQFSLRPIIAEVFYARAVAFAAIEDASASGMFERAARTWDTSRLNLAASRAFVEKARVAGERGDTYSLRVSVERALSYAGSAIDSEPDSYEGWLYRGSLFSALISSQYPQAADNAYTDIQEAKMRAPARPDVYYQEALLELARGRKVDARIALEHALERKSDYAEARTRLDSLSQ